jgi:Spy/CpxP family protein refolding chaperone
MNRSLRSLFALSLLANVLLLGFLIGGLPHRFGRESREERLDAVLRQLPEPTQAQFRRSMEQNRSADDARREQIRAARERTIEILLAEPFDAEAYDAEVAKIDELRGQGSRQMAMTVKEVAADLNLEQRRILAELLKGPPGRR